MIHCTTKHIYTIYIIYIIYILLYYYLKVQKQPSKSVLKENTYNEILFLANFKARFCISSETKAPFHVFSSGFYWILLLQISFFIERLRATSSECPSFVLYNPDLI